MASAHATNDIDIVASIQASHPCPLRCFSNHLSSYLSEDAARDARDDHTFPLHPATGLKVDVIIPGETEFDHTVAKPYSRRTGR